LRHGSIIAAHSLLMPHLLTHYGSLSSHSLLMPHLLTHYGSLSSHSLLMRQPLLSLITHAPLAYSLLSAKWGMSA
jgi:hypothetical protein